MVSLFERERVIHSCIVVALLDFLSCSHHPFLIWCSNPVALHLSFVPFSFLLRSLPPFPNWKRVLVHHVLPPPDCECCLFSSRKCSLIFQLLRFFLPLLVRNNCPAIFENGGLVR